ncbi:MAG: CPBP family glutamic-type intramembrane protease, partial [Peptostreptococcaceae bacterium]
MIILEPITVIVQSVNAASAGVLFGAIYVRTKNIWGCIVIHALVDWLALFISQCFAGGLSVITVDMSILQGGIMIIGGSLPPLLIAMFLL